VLTPNAVQMNTAVVTLTYDSKNDSLTMLETLETPAFFIGVMGLEKTSESRVMLFVAVLVIMFLNILPTRTAPNSQNTQIIKSDVNLLNKWGHFNESVTFYTTLLDFKILPSILPKDNGKATFAFYFPENKMSKFKINKSSWVLLFAFFSFATKADITFNGFATIAAVR
jgi:hypothetical protein